MMRQTHTPWPTAINRKAHVGLATLFSLVLCMPSIGAAPERPVTNQAATSAAVAKLNGAMPRSFDLYPDDPCGGPWHAHTAEGTPIELTVMRYQGVGLVHVIFPQNEDNVRTIRLSSQSVGFTVGNADFIMRCAVPKAALVSMVVVNGEPRSVAFDLTFGPLPLR